LVHFWAVSVPTTRKKMGTRLWIWYQRCKRKTREFFGEFTTITQFISWNY
jgi:hypothetical protein